MKKMRFYHLWLVYLLSIVAGVVYLSYRGLKIDTNFLNILPLAAEQNGFYKAAAKYEEPFADEVLLFVSHPDKTAAISSAEYLAQDMKKSPLFKSVRYEYTAESFEKPAAYFFSKRKILLTEPQIEKIDSLQSASWVEKSYTSLFSPMGAMISNQLKTDPLGLFQEFYLGLNLQTALKLDQGHLISEKDGKTAVFIEAKLNKNFKSLDSELLKFVNEKKSAQNKKYQSEVQAFSAHLFSAAGTNKTTVEMNLFGAISLILILALLLWCFASVFPVLITFGTVVVSALSGLVAVGLFWPSIHILSLLLGISLMGVATDYGVHFFSQGFEVKTKNSREAVDRIKLALGLGFLTSALGYACFYFTDLIILKQLSVFAIVGLFTAYSSVLAVFPKFKYRSLRPSVLKNAEKVAGLYRNFGVLKSWGVVLTVCVVGFLICGKFNFNDDVHLLQQVDSDLKNDEEGVFKFLGVSRVPTYFVLKSASEEELLQLEEQLSKKLLKTDSIRSVALSNWVPSLNKQKDSFVKYQELRATVLNLFAKIKLKNSKAVTDQVFSGSAAYFSVQDFLDQNFDVPIKNNWLGSVDGSFYSVLNIEGAAAYSDLKKYESSSVHVMNKAVEISDYLTELREKILGRFFLGAVLIFAVLIAAFGFKKASLVLLAPMTASFFALLVPNFIFGHLNLFNILAIILTLGIGIDYSIFFASTKESSVAFHIGVLVSFVTTLISFGILAFSSTRAVASFGLSLFLGILLSYVFSLLVAAVHHE